jgi:hypothetical protein
MIVSLVVCLYLAVSLMKTNAICEIQIKHPLTPLGNLVSLNAIVNMIISIFKCTPHKQFLFE